MDAGWVFVLLPILTAETLKQGWARHLQLLANRDRLKCCWIAIGLLLIKQHPPISRLLGQRGFFYSLHALQPQKSKVCCQPNALTCDPVIVRHGQAKSPEGAQVRPRRCDLAPCSAAALLWLDAIAEPSPQFGDAACESAERQSDVSRWARSGASTAMFSASITSACGEMYRRIGTQCV